MSDNISSVERVLRQVAVYWGVKRFDNSGRPMYEQPVEIKCRWEDIHEQFVDDQGHDHVTTAIVMVDRDLVVQGVLWLGSLEQVTSETSPFENKGAFEIKKFDKIPNRAGTKWFREVSL
jgi:hypothetical protein